MTLKIIVSNRGPYRDINSTPLRRSGGGLCSALTSSLSSSTEIAGGDDRILWIFPISGGLTKIMTWKSVRLVQLKTDSEVYDAAYTFASRYLWHLLHGLLELTYLSYDQDFYAEYEFYKKFNHAIAEQVLNVICDQKKDDEKIEVFVNDYHFFFLPHLIKEKLKDLNIDCSTLIFLHTAWPDSTYLKRCASEVFFSEILPAVQQADKIGFLANRWRDRFLEVSENPCNHTFTNPLSIELSVDTEEDTCDVDTLLKDVKIGSKFIFLKIDRVDPIKNILNSLKAYDILVENDLNIRENSVLIVSNYRTRSSIREYKEYANEVDQYIDKLQKKYGSEHIVNFTDDNISRNMALYSISDAVISTSLVDGMNLVAQEAVLISKKHCIPLLSEEMGVTEIISSDAVIANPYDVLDIAEKFSNIFYMTNEERKTISDRIKEKLRKYKSGIWLENIFKEQL